MDSPTYSNANETKSFEIPSVSLISDFHKSVNDFIYNQISSNKLPTEWTNGFTFSKSSFSWIYIGNP